MNDTWESIKFAAIRKSLMKSRTSHITPSNKLITTLSAKWIKYAFGVILFIGLGYQLRHRFVGVSFNEMTLSAYWLPLLLLVFFMMLANWSIEARKWQVAMNSENLTFFEALKTVLVGLSFAILTPGRIGDYAGRAMHSNHRKEALMATFLSSAAQLAITLTFGGIALLMLLQVRDLGITNYSPFWLSIPILVGCFVFFHIESLINSLPRVPKRLLAVLPIQSISNLAKSKILGLSASRFAVYVAQSVLLLTAFQLNIPLFEAILGISILFLVQTLIPMPMLFQVATKIELALLIWAPFDPSIANLSLVMVVLWCINVVVPALVGYRIANFNNLINHKKSPYVVD